MNSKEKTSQRYARQISFAPLGEQGQEKLLQARAAIVGCGALGSVIAEILARAGVGTLRLIDRDLVEITNLQRQFLFDMDDLERGLPKAEAARARLQRINPEITVEARIESLQKSNVVSLLKPVDIILDGTDNFPARYLMNDFAVVNQKPWIYGAAVGSYGLTLTIIPGTTPCLR